MQKVIDNTTFDWSRHKVIAVQRRGTASIITPQLNLNSAETQKARPRCIWPSVIETSDSKYLSRRVWGR